MQYQQRPCPTYKLVCFRTVSSAVLCWEWRCHPYPQHRQVALSSTTPPKQRQTLPRCLPPNFLGISYLLPLQNTADLPWHDGERRHVPYVPKTAVYCAPARFISLIRALLIFSPVVFQALPVGAVLLSSILTCTAETRLSLPDFLSRFLSPLVPVNTLLEVHWSRHTFPWDFIFECQLLSRDGQKLLLWWSHLVDYSPLTSFFCQPNTVALDLTSFTS